MKKRVLSLFLALTLCFTLLPISVFAEEVDGDTVSSETIMVEEGQPTVAGAPTEDSNSLNTDAATEENGQSAVPESTIEGNGQSAVPESTIEGNGQSAVPESTIEGNGQSAVPESTIEENDQPAVPESMTEENGQPAVPESQTEGDGQSTNTGEGEQSNSETDTQTEIWCVSKPDSIGRSYDGTTDGSTIPITLTFTDGTNEIELKEGMDFTAKKTFDSADAGQHTVTVEITLIGEAAEKYKLKAGEEKFEIGGTINKAYPNLTVSLSKTTCAVGEKLLPLLSASGVQENAAVTYYYYTQYKNGYLEFEGSEAVPKIDENTSISEPGTYYIYAKTAETKNYEEQRSTTVELTVAEKANPVASVTAEDGTETTYGSFNEAWTAAIASEGSTLKLLDNVDIGDGDDGLSADTGKFTLDLNGKTLSGKAYRQLIAVGGTADITIQNGKLTNIFSKDRADMNSGLANAIQITGGTTTLENVEVTSGCGEDEEHTGAVYLSAGSLTVASGIFTGAILVMPENADLHPVLKITSATLHNGIVYFIWNTSNPDYDGVKALFADGSLLLDKDEKYIDITNPNYWQTDSSEEESFTATAFAYSKECSVKPHTHALVNGKCECGYTCDHKNADGSSAIGMDGKCTACGAQLSAVIGDTYYADVKSALAAAQDGDTVKLLANVMLSDNDTYVSTTLTLDLNGHSLSGYSLNVGGLTATSQPRTGKLTVIDSSGGNGAVGVTVRDGGTLVFDPKNDSTNLLQLEVYGGTVQLYGGKISRQGLNLQNEIVLGDLLPKDEGLAYYRADSDTQLTLEEAASQTCDLVVKACSHGGENGFDYTSDTCPSCGAPAVAQTALKSDEGGLCRNFADLQTALDVDRDGGSTLQLLADVTGNYTIDSTQDTGLDLNGHSIKGTVEVNAVAEGKNYTTTLSNTQNTTTASIDEVIAHSGAKLAGSGYPAVIGKLWLADTTKWEYILSQPDRLGFKVLNEDGTHKWYAPTDKSIPAPLENVIINSLPITSKSLSFKVDGKNLTGNKVEHGTTVQLCASCNTKDAEVYIYIGAIEGSNAPTYSEKKAEYKQIGTNWYYVVDFDANTIGTYSVYFTASKDGYTISGDPKNLTVTPATIPADAITAPTADTLTYNGHLQELITAGSVDAEYGTMQYSLSRTGDFSTEIPTETDAGTYTVYYKVVGAEGYKDTTAKPIKVTISPIKIDQVMFVNDVTKTYSGSAEFSLTIAERYNCLRFYGEASSLIDVDPGAYAIDGGVRFLTKNAEDELVDSPEAGQKSYMQFTVKLHSKNYVLQTSDGTAVSELTCIQYDGATFTINQATVTPNEITQYVYNDLAKTYTLNLATLLPELPVGCEYGKIQYQGCNYHFTDGTYLDSSSNVSVSKEGILTLPIVSAHSTDVNGQIGTLTVQVVTTNYQQFEFTIKVVIGQRIPLDQSGVSVSATNITYGQTLAESTLTATGSMICPRTQAEIPGTFAWTDGTVKPNAGDYTTSWTFTPAEGYEEYASATGAVTVKVNKADPTFTAPTVNTLTYTGSEQPLLTAGSTQNDTMMYRLGNSGEFATSIPKGKDAGTYTVYYKVVGDGNHNDTAEQPITVTISPRKLSPFVLGIDSLTKAYDGTALASLDKDEIEFRSNGAIVLLPEDAYNITNARFTMRVNGSYKDSPEAGDGKFLSFTVTLQSDNYVFEGDEGSKTLDCNITDTDDAKSFTITKAGAPSVAVQPAVTVINGMAKTYEMVLSNDYLPKLDSHCEYGSVSYSVKGTYLTDGYKDTVKAEIVEENGQYKLKLTVPAVDYDKESSVGTLDLKVVSDNYEDFTLTIGVKTKNKTVPVPDGTISASGITYGQTLAASTITGKMKDGNKEVTGTFTWNNPDTVLNAGDRKVEWTFTPDASYGSIYVNVTGEVTVTVAPKSIEGATVTLKESSFVYDGTVKNPEVESVVLDGETLAFDRNNGYGYMYNATEKVGTYNDFYVSGNGNYTGRVTVQWSITAREVAPTVEIAGGNHVYTGEAIEPTVTVKDDLGNTITPEEYTVSYSNNINAGTATVTVTDREGGSYVLDTVSTTFTIDKSAASTRADIVSSHKSAVTAGDDYSCYTIKATAGAGGSISPSGNVRIRQSENQTFTITPDKGYFVSNVKIDGKSIGAVESYTFENVNEGHTIEVTFVRGINAPKTGDNSRTLLWITLLLVSGCGVTGVTLYGKRKKHSK